MIKVFGIKNCDTMKKAFAWLVANDIAYEFVDWDQRTGWEKLLNTRGLMWRKLTDEERSAVDREKALKLMAQYPSLIKRPVLDTGSQLIVGFSPENYAEQLK